MLKILLTGSEGLVGRPILNVLAKHYEVYSIKRSGDRSLPNVICGDLKDAKSWRNEVINIKPNLVVHCAAEIPSSNNPDSISIYENNWKIDQNVFDLVKRLNSELVYISSTIVYKNSNDKELLTEESPLKEDSYYGKQKIEAERFILNEIPKSWILRINAPYGVYSRVKTVISIFIEAAMQGLPLRYHGSGSRMQDFTNTKDIATLIFQVINQRKAKYGLYNISSGKPISMKELAKLIADIANSKSPVVSSSLEDPQENYRAAFSIEKAVSHLGWHPTSLRDGLTELIKAYR